MNRADAMREVLQSMPGYWWPRRAIFSRADRFFLTNNAASELRARGYDVEHRVIKGQHHYRLLSDRHVTPSAVPIAEQVRGSAPDLLQDPAARESSRGSGADSHSVAGRRSPLGGSSSVPQVDRVDEGPQPPSAPAAVQLRLVA